jgi:hypothetical protein
VVHTPEFTIVKVNLAAYTSQVITRSPSIPKDKQSHIIACNTNFFWKDEPIGFLYRREGLKLLPTKISERSVLVIREGKASIIPHALFKEDPLIECAFQAGPLLVDAGKRLPIKAQMEKEKILPDVNRKCPHLAIGVTKEGKLLIGYFASASLATVAEVMLKNKAISAMNMDGGHSAWLLVRPPNDDRVTPHLSLGNSGLIPVGLKLTFK